MSVYVPRQVEGPMSLELFKRHLKVLPQNVMISLLKTSLNIDDELLQRINSNEEEEESMFSTSLNDLLKIVMGDSNKKLDRPMLANGDATWADRVFKTIDKITDHDPSTECKLKLDCLMACFSLSYTLSLTRANGSDGYFNSRVSAYGQFIKNQDGDPSSKECRATYDSFIHAFSGQGRMGCGLHEALMFAMQTIDNCNQKWGMRPCNLFLLFQILVSDLMFALNYHGTVIEGACNGIGATIIIRDGGGSYRKKYRSPGCEYEAQIFSKSNGTGADFVLGEYKSVTDISIYNDVIEILPEWLEEIKRTSELGLVGVSTHTHEHTHTHTLPKTVPLMYFPFFCTQLTCDISEGVGSKLKIKHKATNAMLRLYSTEVIANGSQSSLSYLQSIVWQIVRNTKTSAGSYSTTRLDKNKSEERLTVLYTQVLYAYMLLCRFESHLFFYPFALFCLHYYYYYYFFFIVICN